MRKVLIYGVLAFLSITSCSQALFLGQMRSAETSGWGSLNLMTGVGVFEDARLVMGTVRYGIASPVDVTGNLAIMDHDASNNAVVVIGGDIQYRITHADLGSPLDMAVGGVIEYFSLDTPASHNYSNLGIGFNFIASKPVKTNSEFSFTPYGRLNLRIDRHDINNSVSSYFREQGLDDTKSKFHIGVNLGSAFPISNKINLIGELQVDEQIGFTAGINFFMW